MFSSFSKTNKEILQQIPVGEYLSYQQRQPCRNSLITLTDFKSSGFNDFLELEFDEKKNSDHFRRIYGNVSQMFIAQSGLRVRFNWNAKNSSSSGIFQGRLRQECISQGKKI